MFKKVIISLLLAFSPVASIVLTIPFSQIGEHTIHVLLFFIMGLAMAGYYLKNDITATIKNKKKFGLIPSFTTFVFAILLVFTATHTMPCPYMMTSHTSQTMIDHPCSQPVPPTTQVLSFIPTITKLTLIPFTIPAVTAFTPFLTTDPRSPPFT